MDKKAVKSILTQIQNNPLIKKGNIDAASLGYYSENKKQTSSVIPTGFSLLDNALLGIGGLPLGRIVDLFGPEAGGKSTIGLSCIAEAQKMGLQCALFDIEQAYFDDAGRIWMQKLGVKTEEDYLLYSRATIAEEVFTLIHASIEAGVKVIMLDSVAALIPREEAIGQDKNSKTSYDNSRRIPALSRVLTTALRQLNSVLADHDAMLICINQVRDYIGFNPTGMPLLSRPGGRAFKHFSSLSLKIQKVGPIKEGKNVVGCYSKVKVEKCKVGPGFNRETGKDTPAHVAIYFDGRKENTLDSILPALIERDIVGHPSPRVYTYKDVKESSKESFIESAMEMGYAEELENALMGNFSSSFSSSDEDDVDIIDEDDIFDGEEE